MQKQILILLLVFGPIILQAQKTSEDVSQDRQIKGVVIAGFNLAQVDGDEVYGFYKFGANLGVGALLPLGKGFSFGIETLFNQKGAFKRFTPAGDSSGLPYYKLRLDYLDVPAMVYFEDRHIWTIGLGFSWGRRVTYHETIRGEKAYFSQYFFNDAPVWVPPNYVPGGDTILKEYSLGKNDWDVIISLQLRVWRHLKFDLRYSYSLINLGKRDYIYISGDSWSRKLYNNLLSFRMLYLLNEKYEPPPKSKKNKHKITSDNIAPWTF